jgi:polyribonucleotide nucleotidyltransferase
VFITGKNGGAEKAKQIIEGMTHEYKVGDTAEGEVVKLMDFGAFVRIAAGTEGLVHVSEIAPFRVEKVADILKEGDRVPVKIIKVDEKGRLNLSIKEANSDFFKPKA